MFTTPRRAQSATTRRPLQCDQLEDRLVPALLVPDPLVVPDPPAVQAFSSLPTAPATLYLDFNGHTQATWVGSYGSFSPGTTLPFNFDGTPGRPYERFTDAENKAIQEIWQRVAEDFAPFNINVTTVEPAVLAPNVPDATANGKALRVVIGGDGSWMGSSGWKGVAAGLNSFSNITLPNVNFVFSDNLGGNNPAGIAHAVSHHAGHAFGLPEAAGSPAGRLALMSQGQSVVTNPTLRTTWIGTVQDEMAILSNNTTNKFGYRPDDHSNSWSGATPLSIPGVSWKWASQVSGKGVIEKTTDEDWFKFTTLGGPVSLTVSPLAVGANLDAKIDLYRLINLGGFYVPQLVVPSVPAGLGASVSVPPLPAGTYYVRVSSHGDYGDVGQYTVTGTGWFDNPVFNNPVPVPIPGNNPLTVVGTATPIKSPVGAATALAADWAVSSPTITVTVGVAQASQPQAAKAVSVLPRADGEDVRRDTGKSDSGSVPLVAAKPTAAIGLRIQADESMDLWSR